MALTAQQRNIATLLYQLARSRGLGPQRAKEFAAAAYAESGLRPGAVNSSSGAGGLFQLLSSGYRQRAKQLGGVFNPRANALAILPDYVKYWQQHPNARPGEAGAAVERSGAGSSFYARGLPLLQQIGGGGSAVPPPARPGLGAPPVAPPAEAAPDRQALIGFIQALNQHQPATNLIGLLQQMRTEAQQAPRPLPVRQFQRERPAGMPRPRGQRVQFIGDLTGERPGFIHELEQAVLAVGGTKVRVNSGYRSPNHNRAVGGVPNSNHLTGHAMDGEVFIPGHGWVPLGVALQGVARRYGLRSGNVPGFYRDGRDPVHVDDGYNQR